MCGITGFVTSRSDVLRQGEAILRQMAGAIEHRGPDADGTWLDVGLSGGAGVGLAHRRLSIIDLSPHGAQPFTSSDGRWVVVYNGEVYNFEQMRRDLPGIEWRGHSDTEVLVEAIARWGVRAAVERCVGMFAFAAWDRDEQALYLVRDRLGIKPLYWGRAAGAFVFGSELKSLRRLPGFDPAIDRDSLTAFLRYTYVPTPRSIYEDVYKLEPGCMLRYDVAADATSSERYWSAPDVARAGLGSTHHGDPDEARDALEALLFEAVGDRMVADVPLGAFLSGGVDSSTVVALMQAQSDRPVKTFSIGFEDEGYDEARYAREVAEHLGTDHTERILRPDDALGVIPQLPTLYDEPFADASQIPTFLVSELARRHVTVSLSGDGGDELFAGYNRHLWGPRVWRVLRRVPWPLRRAASAAMLAVPADRWQQLFDAADPVLPDALRVRLPAEKLQKLAEVVPARDPDNLYRTLASQWKDPAHVVRRGHELPVPHGFDDADGASMAERMMLLDLMTYLPDDILTKVDRASMGVSLEARVPLLDHRVVDFAWRLPMSLKVRDGQSKWLLRQVLYRHVPRELIERPKMGFGVPIDRWLRGPLRSWAEPLLDPDRLRAEGHFDPAPIQQKWREHLQGARNWQYHLWPVLIFQSWLDSARDDVERASREEAA